MRRSRRIGAGFASSAVLTLVWVLGISAPATLDGGGAPAPYRYLSPPPDAATRAVPQSGGGPVRLTRLGSDPANLFTDDAQTALALIPGVFPAQAGESSVDVTITPVAPPADAPAGTTLVGNCYQLTAKYHGSGTAVPEPFPQDALLELSFPLHANAVLQFSAGGWRRLETQASPTVRKVDARTRGFGIFTAAIAPAASSPSAPLAAPPATAAPPWGLLGLGLALLLAIVGVVVVAARRR